MNKCITAVFKDCSKCSNYGLLVLRIGIGYFTHILGIYGRIF